MPWSIVIGIYGNIYFSVLPPPPVIPCDPKWAKGSFGKTKFGTQALQNFEFFVLHQMVHKIMI